MIKKTKTEDEENQNKTKIIKNTTKNMNVMKIWIQIHNQLKINRKIYIKRRNCKTSSWKVTKIK